MRYRRLMYHERNVGVPLYNCCVLVENRQPYTPTMHKLTGELEKNDYTPNLLAISLTSSHQLAIMNIYELRLPVSSLIQGRWICYPKETKTSKINPSHARSLFLAD